MEPVVDANRCSPEGLQVKKVNPHPRNLFSGVASRFSTFQMYRVESLALPEAKSLP